MALRAESTKRCRRANTGLDNTGLGGLLAATSFPGGPGASDFVDVGTGLGGLYAPNPSASTDATKCSKDPNDQVQKRVGQSTGICGLDLVARCGTKPSGKQSPRNMQMVQTLFICRHQRHDNRLHADGPTCSRTLWEHSPHRQLVCGFPSRAARLAQDVGRA